MQYCNGCGLPHNYERPTQKEEAVRFAKQVVADEERRKKMWAEHKNPPFGYSYSQELINLATEYLKEVKKDHD